MSIARHHAEWLSLVPASGPFLSLPVLLEAFPQGLDAHDPEHARLLRSAYEHWEDSFARSRPDPAVHAAWIRFVLTRTLEFDESLLAEGQAIPQTLQAEMAEHHELLRPNIVIIDPATQKARLLVQAYPRSQDLNDYVAGSPWKASPDTRMTELLHATGVRLGLVTNGEHWMLVDAPKGETTGYASWYASLWLEEKITLRAFRSLLSLPRFFGVAENDTIEGLLKRSANNQQEVTTQLGYQVRRAVEVLIHEIAKIEHDPTIEESLRKLVAAIPEGELYESALTVMMRLVFLFCAEERELIPTKPFPVYEQNYSVSTISRQLREIADQQGEELLERRYDAWPRLLTAFRVVFGGVRHDDVYVPAYGGRLFDPDRFRFLEGRLPDTSWRDAEANPLPVNNRTVLHLLEALQLLQVKVPGGGPAEARRLSFRALDIEQIGHVYEGLLDHTAKRASEPFVGLTGTRDKEPEVPLTELEKLLEKGEAHLLKFVKEQTGRSESAVKKALKTELDALEIAHFRTACQGDEKLWKRVEPFADLVRSDSFGYPVVIPKGSVFVTAGTDRRSSGTHYTPRSLTEPIVHYTLEPLVYFGPAEGHPKGEWKLKSAKELLELKICDMACGSGAFLVQAARYMAERLLEAWDEAKKADPDTPGITPEGMPSTGKANEALIPDDPAERKTYAMRIIAQRCLYGVDKNPLAAEMAKLSLWLLTLAKDKPFEFLDHSIRCGDSLVGLHSIDQLRHYSLKPDADDAVLFKGPLDSAVDEAINLRLKLEDLSANSVDDVRRQEKLLIEANEKIARLRCAADLLVAAEFWGESAKDKLERVRHAAVKSGRYVEKGPTQDFEQVAAKERRGQTMFHWPLEFPEVIVNRGGFDAFVGNPPFLGGSKISDTLGYEYRKFVVTQVAHNQKGTADLSAYFLLVANALAQPSGVFGLLLTNTIAEGFSREVSLDQLLRFGCEIIYAIRSQPWPGTASLEISHVTLSKNSWTGSRRLNDRHVGGITSYLTEGTDVVGNPYSLSENHNRVFKGHNVYGQGFVLSQSEAERLLANDARNADVIFPYQVGADLNSVPDQQPERYVINFRDWSLERASAYHEVFRLVMERVKPEREKNQRKARREKWWQYGDYASGLETAIQGHEKVLVRARIANIHSMVTVINDRVFNEKVLVFVSCPFFVMQSSIHEAWARFYSSTLRTDMQYTGSLCLDTFPFPISSTTGEELGRKYQEHRQTMMLTHREGLTRFYNRFHDPEEKSDDIQKLRNLHVEMDQAVAAAYGWTDLELGHGFHETKQGVRFTISEPARREVLQRLLKLNHARYAEEVKQGLHDKKGAAKKAAPKKKAASKPAKYEAGLFDGEDDE